jgi:plasmid stability protein
MAQVVIRNIDDDVIERLRERAKARRQSLEQTLRDALTAAARPSRVEVLKEMARIRALSPKRRGRRLTAQQIIREDRDSH